ncbi:zonular occludens toxin domain-containing protein [Acinetobacter bereziniae]|uniref:zonular occludens toxin domain-containing protein n=1 Tax=Acinetobacter bereziniae TaxID=106648 RepID=UPI0034CED70B
MIYLITATPGSGKTLWAVNEIFKRVNEADPWNIFTNIDGIKLDTAQSLKDKFTDYPPRSLVIIDEAQQITHFSKKYKHPVKNSNHPEVEFLQVHRHADHLDIIFITQAPRLLNPDVLDMVGTHYHLHRPMGMKMATWWMWKYHQLNPNTKSTKADAEDSGTFTYPKNLFGMYKSSDGGTDSHGKIKIPMKIINAVWMLVLVIGATGWLWVKSQPDKKEETVKQEQSIKQEIPTQANSATQQPLVLEQDCRKGVNVEKPECVQWFNDMSKNNASISNDGSVTYDSSKPYDFKPQAKIQVVDYPRLTGCSKYDGKYYAFDQQGNRMPAISQADCKKWLNGERLFDYTKSPQQVQNNAQFNTQSNSTNAVQQISQSAVPKHVEIANNDAQPHLQAQVVS